MASTAPSGLVPLARPFFDEDEIDEVRKVLASGWVSQGPKAKELEDGFARRLGVPHAIAVSNCTAALHVANLALGLGPGDEALVSDFTFPATGHAVAYTGARPVFVDVRPDTYNMDVDLLERHLSPRTKAIVPVHAFGQMAEMDAIRDFAKDHGLAVVEDAACAFGASWKGRAAGTWGDVGCFSFHARKSITTGEGGMLTVPDPEAARLVADLRAYACFGAEPPFQREARTDLAIPSYRLLGYNYKLSDIAAAVGVAQLRKADALLASRRAGAALWDKRLADVPGLALPRTAPGAFHAFQSYVVLVDPAIDRNQVIVKLRERGVQAQIGTYASHLQPAYGSKDECPVSRDVFERSLALPLYHGMGPEDMDRAALALEACLKEARK